MSETADVETDTKFAWLEKATFVGLLIFLALLPFHLVIKGIIPGPVGDYWKEGLLVVLLILWGIRSILSRKLLLSESQLDLPVMLYLGLIFVHLLLNRSGIVKLWGAYISILYLPLFWLVPMVLRKYPKASRSIALAMLIPGTIVGFGAILEFLLNRALWPSVEITLRQGFPDVYIYGTHLRRVYFVLDSPTTLANTLAMILPFAFYFFSQAKVLWQRVLSLVSAAIMFLAIVFTFSRGVWVGIAVTVVVIFFIRYFENRRQIDFKRAGMFTGTAILVAILIWLATPVKTDLASKHTLELTPSGYQSLTLAGEVMSLQSAIPAEGAPVKQIWTIYDPISQAQDSREIVNMPPTSAEPVQLTYPVMIPEQGMLKFAIALDPEVWSPDKGDGVNFVVYLTDVATNKTETIFNRYINPKSNPNERRWRNYVVDLSPWAGKEVTLTLATEAGPNKDFAFDWAGWAGLEIGKAPTGYVAANLPRPQNSFSQHLGSITNWATDESNRDRLSAWNLAFLGWKQSPVFGRGIGTTGTAGLRTMPQNSIVTESQPLKAIVETGIPGLLIWGFLWFVILRIGIQIYKNEAEIDQKYFLLAILAALLIVFIDGLVYQNLEVKQVNAYFWTLVGMLGFFASRPGVQSIEPKE
ncbi:MAG TPA: O-antigen ligase family protein [Bellilinea sp.]|nr:O-antigen ligase family protein [Bellilinea sp.]